MLRVPATPHLASPSSEEQVQHSGTREIIDRDDLSPASTRLATEVRTRWMYFLLGCAILLPWNVLTNGSSYFLSRLADSPFWPTFGSYLSGVYTITKFVFQFYSAISLKRSSPSHVICTSIIAMVLLVACLWVSTFIQSTASTFFLFALFMTAALATAAAYLCTAVYASAALHDPSSLRTVLSGHAAIAVITSLVDVSSALISLWDLSPRSGLRSVAALRTNERYDQAEEIAARIFFGASIPFLGITLVTYVRSAKHFQASHRSVPRSLEQHFQVEEIDENTRLLANNCRVSTTEADLHVYRVFKENLTLMFSITYSFVVTMAVFPAITIRVQPVNPGVHPMLFTAVHLLVFNVADLVGRSSCLSTHLAFWSEKAILAMVLLRTLFIPMILACNIPRAAMIPSALPIMYSDTLFMLIILALGFTQGYVLTLAMLAVSSLEHNPRLKGRHEDVQVAATLSGTLGIVGLAAGSLASFAVQAMI